jgi:hypothetical protein
MRRLSIRMLCRVADMANRRRRPTAPSGRTRPPTGTGLSSPKPTPVRGGRVRKVRPFSRRPEPRPFPTTGFDRVARPERTPVLKAAPVRRRKGFSTPVPASVHRRGTAAAPVPASIHRLGSAATARPVLVRDAKAPLVRGAKPAVVTVAEIGALMVVPPSAVAVTTSVMPPRVERTGRVAAGGLLHGDRRLRSDPVTGCRRLLALRP